MAQTTEPPSATDRGDGVPAAAAEPTEPTEPTEPAEPAEPTSRLDSEMLDRLRLAAVPGLSPRLVARLVADIGSAGSVFTARRERIAAVRGVGDARASLLAGAPSRDDVLRDVERARAASAVVVVPGCPGWPLVLDELPDPPSALWGRGDLVAALAAAPPGPGGLAPEWIDVLRTRGVGIVGSRKASSYGLAQAERLGHDLAAMGITVVSGLARGIDAAAHRGALRAGGRTVGVLGGGLARFYPPENVSLAREMVAAGGAVVSEFPLDMPPLPHHFPRRNRLIAALSAAVVVVEAAERSGSLLTADHALDLGREVLAVPGRVDQPNSRGVHRLLREGAALCESAADVLTALGIELPGSGAPDVSTPASGAGRTGAPPNAATPTGRTPTEQALLDALADEERDADALIDATGLPPSAGLVALSALELRGVVRIAGDGRYEIVRSI